MGSGQHVPVQVKHVPVHPSSGQHVPVQVEHGTCSSNSPRLTCFRVVRSRIRVPMSRDPKKRLNGVQLRLEIGE